jgi:hypothetical protein
MDPTLVMFTMLMTFGGLLVRRILFALKTILKLVSR